MPRWLRWLQPLLSGVFTVDNLDYVRRDAYLIGVSAGPVDVERLRRYSFVGPRGLSLYEPGLGALEMFLTARLFMYQQIYFHRSVRAIDLDLAEVFRPSILAIFGEGSPADDLSHYADLDEYALLHQAALWARGEALSDDPAPGDGTVTPEVGRVWQAILLRRPRWRAEAELRRDYEGPERDATRAAAEVELGRAKPGRVIVDLAEIDARPAEATATDSLLAVVGRDGAPGGAAQPVAGEIARLLAGGQAVPPRRLTAIAGRLPPPRAAGRLRRADGPAVRDSPKGERRPRRPRRLAEGLHLRDVVPVREHQQRVDPGDLGGRQVVVLDDCGRFANVAVSSGLNRPKWTWHPVASPVAPS